MCLFTECRPRSPRLSPPYEVRVRNLFCLFIRSRLIWSTHISTHRRKCMALEIPATYEHTVKRVPTNVSQSSYIHKYIYVCPIICVRKLLIHCTFIEGSCWLCLIVSIPFVDHYLCQIVSSSMQPSLAVGDRLLVDKVRLTIPKKTDILRLVPTHWR